MHTSDLEKRQMVINKEYTEISQTSVICTIYILLEIVGMTFCNAEVNNKILINIDNYKREILKELFQFPRISKQPAKKYYNNDLIAQALHTFN